MSRLKDLLEERYLVYKKYSDEILAEISSNVIPAVLEMLQLTDQELEKIRWDHVQLIDNHIVLTGGVRYNSGDVVTDGETTVTLDGQLAMMLDKLIRVAIPAQLAYTGSRADVLEHLQSVATRLREEYKAIYGHEPETYEDAVRAAMPQQLGMDFGPDFDYSDLTEEQLEAFFLSGIAMNSMGDKPN